MFVVDEIRRDSESADLDIETDIFTSDESDKERECLEKYKNSSANASDALVACPPAWDSFHCWPPAEPGSVISYPCDRIFSFFGEQHQKGFAYRECSNDGQWSWGNWTNYSDCVNLLPEIEDLSPVTVSYIIFVCSIISLIFLGITLFIFSYFKSLQCSRIRVHKNLVISLIVHSTMMLTISLPGIFNEVVETFTDMGWLCKTILTIKMYSAMTCIHWMFVEGLLLHSSITVSVFQQEPPFNIYYAIGWGFPFICVLTWVILMTLMLNSPCWKGYGKHPFIWFITGPMIVALIINTIFLINIIRILITKLRTSVSIETKQVRKAIRATALLFPLLGITHLLFCINPRDDAHLEHAYMITNAVLQSSQGIFVAVLYCFFNTEVQSVLLSAYMRATVRRHLSHCSRGCSNARKMTSSFSTTTSVYHNHELTNGSGAALHRYKMVTTAIPLHHVAQMSTENKNEQQDLQEKETLFVNRTN